MKGVDSMVKRIEISEETAKSLPFFECLSSMSLSANYTPWQKENYVFFRDVEGKAYFSCHGTESGYLLTKDGKPTLPQLVYAELFNADLIEKGEELYINCCYGRTVMQRAKEFSKTKDWKECRALRSLHMHINFVNASKFPAYNMLEQKNGKWYWTIAYSRLYTVVHTVAEIVVGRR
jgi:hypothetical protein